MSHCPQEKDIISLKQLHEQQSSKRTINKNPEKYITQNGKGIVPFSLGFHQ